LMFRSTDKGMPGTPAIELFGLLFDA